MHWQHLASRWCFTTLGSQRWKRKIIKKTRIAGASLIGSIQTTQSSWWRSSATTILWRVKLIWAATSPNCARAKLLKIIEKWQLSIAISKKIMSLLGNKSREQLTWTDFSKTLSNYLKLGKNSALQKKALLYKRALKQMRTWLSAHHSKTKEIRSRKMKIRTWNKHLHKLTILKVAMTTLTRNSTYQAESRNNKMKIMATILFSRNRQTNSPPK